MVSNECLLDKSFFNERDESIRSYNLQNRTERKNTNEKFGLIVLIITELNLIEPVVKLQSFLLEMREVEKHTLKGISLIMKKHGKFTHALLRKLHTVCVIFLQKLTGPDTGEIDGVHIALSTGLEPELIVF